MRSSGGRRLDAGQGPVGVRGAQAALEGPDLGGAALFGDGLAARGRQRAAHLGQEAHLGQGAVALGIDVARYKTLAFAYSSFLAGLAGGFLAQGLKPFDAARASVYLHGRAGDMAAASSSESSLMARDLIACLPGAFREFRR